MSSSWHVSVSFYHETTLDMAHLSVCYFNSERSNCMNIIIYAGIREWQGKFCTECIDVFIFFVFTSKGFICLHPTYWICTRPQPPIVWYFVCFIIPHLLASIFVLTMWSYLRFCSRWLSFCCPDLFWLKNFHLLRFVFLLVCSQFSSALSCP